MSEWQRTGVTMIGEDGVTYAQELHNCCAYEWHERWVALDDEADDDDTA